MKLKIQLFSFSIRYLIAVPPKSDNNSIAIKVRNTISLVTRCDVYSALPPLSNLEREMGNYPPQRL